MKKDRFRKNGVLAFLAGMPILPDRRVKQPRLNPGDVVDIRIVGLSKSKKAGFFQVLDKERK